MNYGSWQYAIKHGSPVVCVEKETSLPALTIHAAGSCTFDTSCSTVSATVISVALTETLKALKRDGVNVDAITDGQFIDMFELIGSGKTAKESITEVLTWLAENEDATVEDALESLGLSMMSRKEVKALVDEVINKNSEFIKQRGKGAFGPVMGMVMKKARGRVKPNVVNEILKNKLSDL